MTSTRSLLVLHVSDERPHAPGYQRLLDELNRATLAGVRAAGWEPTLVATDTADVDEVLTLARTADAVVIMGGEDVTPALYGGAEEYPDGGHHVPHSDDVLLAVIRDAIARRSPLLGICRGQQLLNVACGGTLVQHMEGHRLTGDQVWVRTRLSEDAALSPGAHVWCTHHQAVAEVGKNLTVVARAADGVIEALAHDHAPVLGVQWHPEHPAVAAVEVPALLARVTEKVPA
ncbi:gamma-glutamyl-gamma-aminobutyrate hydrolase family protein [Demequina sp. NBRC 110051]|uniref:gamma-glutamyl-gamma-aminobutyrate hydrolase family protein n=1 Tax=Demequina sp. NBRC 110051 TaxID=1570340 RepID=UPI000A021BA2|nr:gamma-glutamyl-gamma-aminobutyrate hydrolase family protein [Demequina sp. NBRC 110051]